VSIDVKQLRKYVIQPSLKHIGLYSAAAENLLVLTAAQESQAGKYIHQLGNGPACGIFQMEPATHDDIWRNYLEYKPVLRETISNLDLPNLWGSAIGTAQEMCGNMYYAAAMCRLHYLRVPTPLPNEHDTPALALYWKRWYNTPLGSGTAQQAIDNYRRFV